ncbi:hypothetical protein SAMN05444166_4432 [Singulisphaera sp. GP187]|uniref:hypothetical protein n=1 Tax=Singulisphaera sp. GP187 TaxID=1882752 RepID=UPI00092A4BFE|nr:hypothetical protein [Singulisphaera sp. GP187]SIO40524.1 hypothetical protein SAMN05444166_4432 [Singulisphaera sp. GP187]
MAFRWLRRLSPVRDESIGVAILLVLVSAGLVWVSLHPAPPTQGDEYDEVPANSGTIVRSEVIHLWLPESIRELASPQSSVVRDPSDLRRYLERRNLQDLRYAVTIRGHQPNGDYYDIHFIRHPCESPVHFQELLNILADVSRAPGHEKAANFPGASTHDISEAVLSREPSEIIAELDRIRGGRR